MKQLNSLDLHTVTLSDRAGNTRSVKLAETGLEIGRGTRASIEKVLVDGKPMAQKNILSPVTQSAQCVVMIFWREIFRNTNASI